jgi:hypothetical protein
MRGAIVPTKTTQAELEEVLRLLRQAPFDAVDTALRGQLRAVESWGNRLEGEPPLAAVVNLLRAQIAANQRMIELAKRETEAVATAMVELGKSYGLAAPSEAAAAK